jgi:hypothetical protein
MSTLRKTTPRATTKEKREVTGFSKEPEKSVFAEDVKSETLGTPPTHPASNPEQPAVGEQKLELLETLDVQIPTSVPVPPATPESHPKLTRHPRNISRFSRSRGV